jgi:aminoglycoside 2''-phosphotransferase
MSVDKAELLRQRVQGIMPDLEIRQFEVNQEGLINDVVIINHTFVFRFAKTENNPGLLDGENKILDLIRPRIGVEIPTPVFRSTTCMVYPFLDGKPLRKEIIGGLNEIDQASLAEQLGNFLYRLHSTDISNLDWKIPPTLAPVTWEKWVDIRQRVEEKVYPLLLPHQIIWAENLFNSVLENPAFFEYEPALIHGDLASYHLLFDDQKNRITGVIDFGVAGVGDPASDIGSLINIYGESFVTRMRSSYAGLEKYLPRARFYAQSIELQWVLLGIETGETFWFTAHLGGARDIMAQLP